MSSERKYKLRLYQQKVVDEIGDENAIVKMPTGSGKTFVAAEFIKRGLQKVKLRKQAFLPGLDQTSHSSSDSLPSLSRTSHKGNRGNEPNSAALFLVPTCELVAQQARALRNWIGDCIVVEYMGGKASPTTSFDVIVTTPAAFLTLQTTEADKRLFSWSNFFACVFDEVHHVLKDHPYRIIAHHIKNWQFISEDGHRVHIVGLSASLTYAVGHKAVERALGDLCHDLSVTKMISPSAEELEAGGYVPQDDNIETMHKPWEVPEGVILESERKPHLIFETFFSRIETGETTHFARCIYNVVRSIERDIENEPRDEIRVFESPLSEKRLAMWEEYANGMRSKSWQCRPVQSLYELLEVWYVALRMVVQSWEEEEELVLQWLKINNGLHKEGWFSPALISSLNAVSHLLKKGTIQSEKLKSLKKNLLEKKKKFGASFRTIVFVKQRISAFVISRYLNDDTDPDNIGFRYGEDYGLEAGFVVARNSRITPSVKITSGDCTKCIEQFRQGTIQILVATSVIEEGFDVPEANVIISYDYIKDSVELCQRFGRARQVTSSLTLMSERKDRSLSALKDVKKHQESIIRDFLPGNNQQHILSRQQSQVDRERAASNILKDTERCEKSPLEVLNMYAAKTKAVAKTDLLEMGPDRIFRCKIVYSSLSRTLEGAGEGRTKKLAQHETALDLLRQLRKSDELKGL